LIAIAASFALRLAIAACSWGSSDTIAFARFAWSIDRIGLLATYRIDSELNHPPLAAYWAWLALRLAGHSAYGFAFIFRLPMILADAGSVWLLSKISRGKQGPRPLAVAALFAWCPAAILVSAYHGNTDSLYAFLCLLCVYLLNANRIVLAGVALAAAINIKLIPILLIVPLLLSLPNRHAAAKFIGGLLVGIIPFLIPLIGAPASFAHNALAYASRFDLWGINLILSIGTGDLAGIPHVVLIYRALGRCLIVALVLAWAVLARIKIRPSRYDLAAGTFAIFLVFAPGFGVQYLVILLPLLFAARPRLATVFGLLAGAFLFAAYATFWDGGFPLSSLFNRTFPPILAFVGLPAWGTLVYYLASAVIPSAGVWGSRGGRGRKMYSIPAPD
jgi:hypothetical protein